MPNHSFSYPSELKEVDGLSMEHWCLYGMIDGLSKKTGYCYASRSYLADEFGWSCRKLDHFLGDLIKAGVVKKKRMYRRLHLTPALKVSHQTVTYSQSKSPDGDLEGDVSHQTVTYSQSKSPNGEHDLLIESDLPKKSYQSSGLNGFLERLEASQKRQSKADQKNLKPKNRRGAFRKEGNGAVAAAAIVGDYIEYNGKQYDPKYAETIQALKEASNGVSKRVSADVDG